jgi:hypothetical protein
MVLILRTTHPVVDDYCHQARCKDLGDPLPEALIVQLVLRQVHLGYAQVVDLYVREIANPRT